MKIKHVLSMGLLALLVVATPDGLLAGTATPESIIVMPARKRVVHLAFQIARCKDVGLVSINNAPNLPAPLIHVWDGEKWVEITNEEYVQGSFMSGEPRHVFILGDSHVLPALAGSGDWAKNAQVIPSLETANLINTIGKTLKFSGRQWKWLADVNDLSVADQNAERRRYGRWGAPGKEVDLSPVKKMEENELPPAPVIEAPAKEVKAEVAPIIKVAPKAEPKPVETKKPEPRKEVRTEAKPEVKKEPAVKAEAPKKAEAAKPAEAKKDVKAEKQPEVKAEAKKEAAKVEAPKTEVAKHEAKPAEAVKVEAKKAEPKKVEAPKAEAPKVEPVKPEAKKPVEPPKAEAVKPAAETAKVEYTLEKKVAAPIPPVVEKPATLTAEPELEGPAMVDEAPEAK